MLKKTLALIGLTMSISANAAILSIDSDFGADTITRDTATGLDWLDLTETVNLSYNYVNSNFGSGGVYNGWRYATLAETQDLIVKFGLPIETNITGGIFGGIPDAIRSGVTEFTSYLGDTVSVYSLPSLDRMGFMGLVDYSLSTGHHYRVHVVIDNVSQNVSQEFYTVFTDGQVGGLADDTGDGNRGSFLVRPSEVPIPAAAWLFGSALLGLVGASRRK